MPKRGSEPGEHGAGVFGLRRVRGARRTRGAVGDGASGNGPLIRRAGRCVNGRVERIGAKIENATLLNKGSLPAMCAPRPRSPTVWGAMRRERALLSALFLSKA